MGLVWKSRQGEVGLGLGEEKGLGQFKAHSSLAFAEIMASFSQLGLGKGLEGAQLDPKGRGQANKLGFEEVTRVGSESELSSQNSRGLESEDWFGTVIRASTVTEERLWFLVLAGAKTKFEISSAWTTFPASLTQ